MSGRNGVQLLFFSAFGFDSFLSSFASDFDSGLLSDLELPSLLEVAPDLRA